VARLTDFARTCRVSSERRELALRQCRLERPALLRRRLLRSHRRELRELQARRPRARQRLLQRGHSHQQERRLLEL